MGVIRCSQMTMMPFTQHTPLLRIHGTDKARRMFYNRNTTGKSHDPMGSIVGTFCRLLKRTPESSDPESLSTSA